MVDQFGDLLNEFLQSNPELKKPYDYLSMKKGIIPLKVGFNQNPEPSQNLPTIQLQGNQNPLYSQSSSSHVVNYGFAHLMSLNNRDITSQICDSIIEQSTREVSLKLYLNKNSEISTIEQQLCDVIQKGSVDIATFSKNSITNLTEYDFEGNPIAIRNAIIDPQIKKYVEFTSDQLAIYNQVPHQIRKKKKVKKPLSINKKSQREILSEFQILNSMFDSKTITSQSNNNIQQILQATNLCDSSYQDLWQKIVGDMKIQQNTQKNKYRNKGNVGEMEDGEFQRTIQRIVQEAVEYEKEVLEIQDQDEEEEEQVQVLEEQTEKVQEKEEKKQPVDDFEKAKIQKKTKLAPTSKYQYAIEDETDLTNFYDLLPKQKFACEYKFELDEFQKRSILHLQRKQSVFVAAHTSAGKTVVAEYGIALAIKHKRKVIYTSPIKALSNQKYRELSMKFGSENVGIVTGDVSMNQQASCVIMTTEILRNNLYRGTEMIRDIQWVIFDEVHYINNQQRGVVWEETIILLPEHIGIIMLSATVPNYMDFANWVGRTKHRIIYVMKTFKRPVPLEHSLYIFNKFHVIKEANGRFLREQYNELHDQIRMADVNTVERNKALKEQKKKKIEERGFYNDVRREQRIKLMNKNAVDKFIKKITKADMETVDGKQQHRILQELIVDCNKKKLLPCVIFNFSKKKINAMAAKIYSYDLTTHSEKSKIVRMITSALSNLKPEDQQIDQFHFLKEICVKGYAVHHGDLLPLAKQIVELLFSQGLIKVLFATETFAMGINMPTKTVIFNAIKKPTGSQGELRLLNSSEYVQMSGRAGRRGLDEKGTVIIVVKDPSSLPSHHQMEKMVDYPGQKLESKFRVTYQIILNLINSDDLGVTEMMRQSFFENPKFSEFASNIKSLKQYQNEYQSLSEFECPYNKLGTRILMDEYMSHAKDLKQANNDAFRNYMNEGKNKNFPKYAKFLGHNNQQQVGLILRVEKFQHAKGPFQRNVQVMVVNKVLVDIQITKEERKEMEKVQGIKKKVILEYDEEKKSNINTKFYSGQVPGTQNQYHYYVHWISPGMILEIYSNKINSKFSFEDKKQDFQSLSQQLLKLPGNLNPLTNNETKQTLYQLFTSSHCHTCDLKQLHQHQFQRRGEVKTKLSQCAKKLDKNQLGMMGNFQGMLLVLAQFGFINQSIKQDGTIVNNLTLKGRIAKQVDIFVAEVVVEAILDPLDSAEIAALLSAFVCDYKPRPGRGEQDKVITPIPDDVDYSTGLTKAIGKTLRVVKQIAEVEEQCEAYLLLTAAGMDEHIMSIANFHLAETVYKWAIGFDFNEARTGTKAPEGTIVRTIMRLSQLLANTKSVCRIIGNNQLQSKIDIAIQSIKRDIVFCQSLYLTG